MCCDHGAYRPADGHRRVAAHRSLPRRACPVPFLSPLRPCPSAPERPARLIGRQSRSGTVDADLGAIAAGANRSRSGGRGTTPPNRDNPAKLRPPAEPATQPNRDVPAEPRRSRAAVSIRLLAVARDAGRRATPQQVCIGRREFAGQSRGSAVPARPGRHREARTRQDSFSRVRTRRGRVARHLPRTARRGGASRHRHPPHPLDSAEQGFRRVQVTEPGHPHARHPVTRRAAAHGHAVIHGPSAHRHPVTCGVTRTRATR